MAKIVFPDEDTISNVVMGSVNDALKSLTDAEYYCNFSYPGNLPIIKNIKSVSSTIRSYKNELKNIYNSSLDTDRSIQSLRDGLESNRNSLNVDVIEERGRLIK